MLQYGGWLLSDSHCFRFAPILYLLLLLTLLLLIILLLLLFLLLFLLPLLFLTISPEHTLLVQTWQPRRSQDSRSQNLWETYIVILKRQDEESLSAWSSWCWPTSVSPAPLPTSWPSGILTMGSFSTDFKLGSLNFWKGMSPWRRAWTCRWRIYSGCSLSWLTWRPTQEQDFAHSGHKPWI